MAAASGMLLPAPQPARRFVDLPGDAHLAILSFLDVRSVLHVAECSLKCTQIINDPRLWHTLHTLHFATLGNPQVLHQVRRYADWIPPLPARPPPAVVQGVAPEPAHHAGATPLLLPPGGAAAGGAAPPAPRTSALTQAVASMRGVVLGQYWEPTTLPTHANPREAFRQAMLQRSVEVDRNEAAQSARRGAAVSLQRGACLRLVLDGVNVLCAQMLPLPAVLASVVMLAGELQGTWALGWWAVLSPLLGILGVHIAAWLLAVFVEGRTLSTLADPTSPWHLQGQASRFSLCGQLALQYQRVVHRGKDRDVPGIRDRQRIGGAVVAGAILFLSLGVLLPVLKAAGVAGLTWAGAFVPIFVLLGLLWLAAPWLLDADDTEEAAAASTCCFCCVSLPTICTLAMVAARFDGSSPDISVADMIIPIAIVLGVLVCFACMMTVLLAHEGELGGNPAGQRVFSCFCLCFCTVVGGLTSTLGLLAAVDAGNLPAVGVLYPETHTYNASSLPPGVNATGNATTVDVTTWEEGDVSWWLLLLPAMVMLAYLSVLACAASCLGWLVQRMKVPRFYRRPTHSLPHEMTEHV